MTNEPVYLPRETPENYLGPGEKVLMDAMRMLQSCQAEGQHSLCSSFPSFLCGYPSKQDVHLLPRPETLVPTIKILAKHVLKQ